MFDTIVVGGGPAGLSAALMLGRCRRRVLVCDLGEPRNRRSHALHGYLTRDGVAPADLRALGRAELSAYGVAWRETGVVGASWRDDHFDVRLAGGGQERALYLLLATGVADDLPLLPGIDECYGLSVFHCPYCDGWEWRDRPLAALGRPDPAARLALALKAWSANVTVCTNGDRVGAAWRGRLERNTIAVRTEPIAGLDHDAGRLGGIRFAEGANAPCAALFFTAGQHPHSDLAVRLGCTLNARGTVKASALSETNVPRVFVAGDASRDAQFVVVAAAEGVKAAVAINQAMLREEAAP